MIATGQAASAMKELTPTRAFGVFLREVVSASEGSELMTGMAFRSAVRSLVGGTLLGMGYWKAFELELQLYDGAVKSTANDINQVLRRSYGGRSP